MKKFGKNLLGFLLIAAVSSGTTIATYKWLNEGGASVLSGENGKSAENGYAKPVVFSPMAAHAIETDFTQAAEKAVNGVVHIKSTQNASNGNRQSQDPIFEHLFGFRGNGNAQPKPRVGMGSGVIISTDGYIVTNNHVIDESDELEVTLNDNRRFNAKVIGTDPTTDLALLKIEAENLPVIKFGDSDNLKVGEWVLAVGNPFQLNSTVTAGIVSAKARSIGILANPQTAGIEAFIQTDAAVNPGNSGGALVNTSGELVGINTAIYSKTGEYVGYSFAIPSSIVSKVIADLKQYGTVQRAMLGVEIADISPDLEKSLNITINEKEGAYVANVTERSSAMEAGIKKGDIITSINGTKVKTVANLMEQVSRYRPGDKIKVSYIRDGKENETNVTLKNYKGNTSITRATGMESLGAAFKDLKPSMKQTLGIRNGVQVDGITNGKFKEAGIRDGFIILRINDTPVTSSNDIEKIFNNITKSNSQEKVMFIVGLYPNGKTGYYAVDLSE